ncbi:MAG: prepilin peptidase [Candidatus Aminicenantales bacterium]
MEAVIIILAGLAWGSFLNVLIYRLPLRMSLLRPPSSCPECGTRIKWYDNIPLLSYLFLGGKCRACKARISLFYPLVELITPLSFLVLFFSYGLRLALLASCLFTSALIVLFFIDLKHQLLPDEITLPSLLLALVYSIFRPDLSLREALVGAVVGGGFLVFVYLAYLLARKKEGLGMGDVTMMLMLGAFLGWERTFLTLVLASFSGALIGILIISFRKKDFQYSLPFGSFLAPAAYISLLWGEKILSLWGQVLH